MRIKHTFIITTIAALVGIVSVGHAPVAGQQPAPAARYTPAPGAKDVKAVLFNWFWHMGMLRGPQEIEAVATLEHKATGTIHVDGQPCTLTSYRVSTNYQVPGQRIQYVCARPNGQEYKAIEVVSGQYAWDEDIVGAEIVPGRGKAAPKPAALNERLIRLWAGPQGAAKGCRGGRRQDDRVARHGQAGRDVPDSRRSGGNGTGPRSVRRTRPNASRSGRATWSPSSRTRTTPTTTIP